jgi:hypothetical protein
MAGSSCSHFCWWPAWSEAAGSFLVFAAVLGFILRSSAPLYSGALMSTPRGLLLFCYFCCHASYFLSSGAPNYPIIFVFCSSNASLYLGSHLLLVRWLELVPELLLGHHHFHHVGFYHHQLAVPAMLRCMLSTAGPSQIPEILNPWSLQ